MAPGMDQADHVALPPERSAAAHYDPGLEHQTPAFDAAQGELEMAGGRLFEDDAEGELAGFAIHAVTAATPSSSPPSPKPTSFVLDDFGLAKLNAENRRELLEDCYAWRSTLPPGSMA